MTAANTAQRPSSAPKSPLFNYLLAAGFGYGAWWLWQYHAIGQQGFGIGAAILAFGSLRALVNGLSARAHVKRIRKAKKAAMTVRKTQGSARFSNVNDAKAAGMLDDGGYFLGELTDRKGKRKELYHNGEGSVFCWAPPGTGKTVGGAMIQCLKQHFDKRGRPMSLVVLDISAEIYAVTHKYMRKHYNVVCISPWAAQFARDLGIDIKDRGYNPMLKLHKAGVETKDLAEALAVLLLPGKAEINESSQHFLDWGRLILTWGMLVLALEEDAAQLNLPALRRLLMSDPDTFERLLVETSKSEAFNGALQQAANKMRHSYDNGGEEFSGALSTATRALNVYDDFGVLGQHISVTDGYDFTKIKEKPTVVYIMIPPEKIPSHGPSWLNLCLSCAIEDMTRDRSNRGVWCIFDEIANISYCPVLLRAVALYRKFGLRFSFYCQSSAQMSRIYSENGLRELLSMCDVIQAFGVREPHTLKMLSELAGNDTVKEFNQTLNPDLAQPGQLGMSTTASGSSQAILRPDDIRTLPENKQIIFYKNVPPFIADKVAYFDRAKWKKRASDNPYYRD